MLVLAAEIFHPPVCDKMFSCEYFCCPYRERLCRLASCFFTTMYVIEGYQNSVDLIIK